MFSIGLISIVLLSHVVVSVTSLQANEAGEEIMLRFLPCSRFSYHQSLEFEGSFRLQAGPAGSDVLGDMSGYQNGTLSANMELVSKSDASREDMQKTGRVPFMLNLKALSLEAVLNSELSFKYDSHDPLSNLPEDATEAFEQLDGLLTRYGPFKRMLNGRAASCEAFGLHSLPTFGDDDKADRQTSESRNKNHNDKNDICVTPLMGSLFYPDHKVSVGKSWSEEFQHSDRNIHITTTQVFTLEDLKNEELTDIATIHGVEHITLAFNGELYARMTMEAQSVYTVDVETGVPIHWKITGMAHLPMMPLFDLSFQFHIDSRTEADYIHRICGTVPPRTSSDEL
jgi:hypothetical protein